MQFISQGMRKNHFLRFLIDEPHIFILGRISCSSRRWISHRLEADGRNREWARRTNC
jgi:hypothetical protein